MILQKINNSNLSRKEREKLNRKQEILSAAIPLFAKKGYENTTIDEIAEKAEFGKGTIYNYFHSKEEIHLGIYEGIFEALLASLREIDQEYEKFHDFIERLTRETFNFCVNNSDAFILIARHRTKLNTETTKTYKFLDDYHKKTDAIIERRIKAAIKSKEIKKIDADSFIILYRSMIFPYVYKKMFCDERTDINVKKESNLIVDILFNGISRL